MDAGSFEYASTLFLLEQSRRTNAHQFNPNTAPIAAFCNTWHCGEHSMWVRLEATEIDRLKQWVSVIQQMNPRYARLRVWDLLDAMDKLAAEPWYYEHQQYKVVVLFQYNRRFRRWHLEHLGFVGSTTPSEVLDLIIEMGATFLQTHGVDSIFTIRPTVVEFEPLRQLRDAADTHADLQMTVVREYELAKLLEIHYIGAPIVGTE